MLGLKLNHVSKRGTGDPNNSVYLPGTHPVHYQGLDLAIIIRADILTPISTWLFVLQTSADNKYRQSLTKFS